MEGEETVTRKYNKKGSKTTTPQGYNEYMKFYMRDRRKFLKAEEKRRMNLLKTKFPDAFELVFGKKRR